MNLKEELQLFGDLNKYKFILTEIELFILNEVKKQFDEGERNINFDYISKMAFISYKTHKIMEPLLLLHLFWLSYDKIKNINNQLKKNKHNLVNISFLEALKMNSNNKSIKFYDFLALCNNGKINIIKNELNEFVIKYILGTADDSGKIDYGVLARLCYELGYTNKELNIEIIKDIVLYTNDKLWEIYWLDYGLEIINKRRK